jgi:Reverse transcriptase (RNA-dependent DNA polymerase)
VYVDDIILTENNASFIQQFVQMLDQRFIIKDLGQLHFFLGIEVNDSKTGLLLTQSKYIYSILDRVKMQGAKPNVTPMIASKALSHFDGNSVDDPCYTKHLL